MCLKLLLFGIASTIVSTSCQNPHSQIAIISDNRYLSGDGTFGASYAQEDGVVFKEESDANGDRKGSYSYVDPNGQRRTVHYTAGKNGFQASGDGIPEVTPPAPEYEPLPEYQSPEYRSPQPKSYQYQAEEHSAPAPAYRPNPGYQPAYQQPQPAYYQAQYRPAPSPPPPTPSPRQYKTRPDFQPEEQYESPLVQYKPHYQPANFEYSFSAPVKPAPAPSPLPSPSPYQYSHHHQITTPRPGPRFYPPGTLDFTRTPDGYSYSFKKT